MQLHKQKFNIPELVIVATTVLICAIVWAYFQA